VNNPLICSHCRKPITGKYSADYWGNNYHREHIGKVPACDYCGRLISRTLTKGGKIYSDGKQICGICLSGAINDSDAGKKILQIVHDRLAVYGIEISPFKPEFFLIDRSRLQTLSRGREKQGFAKFSRKTINGSVKSFSLQIYIVKGLPKISFISTAAHELMHIWFYSRNITDIQTSLEEGSCNYAAYLILNSIESPDAAFRIYQMKIDNSPVYGKGFHRIQKMVESKGLQYWLQYIQTHQK
jgi:hypothetical protein